MIKLYSLQTIVTGTVQVTIEEVGSFEAQLPRMPLAAFAGHVYVVLTGNICIDDGDFFELVSFEPEAARLVVRVK